MNTIDLRSDTVSWPTEAMRQAMATATVGDDVYGEDPTVNQLERDAAAKLGKEAGLFVSSGTQGNLIALLAHCDGRGAEVILGDKAHTFVYEAGGMAVLGGIQPRTVPVQPDGTLELDAIRHAIRGDDYHFPRTQLITLENTQGTVGGVALSKAYMDAVADLAHRHDLPLHIDGARIFNAATATHEDPADLVAGADSLTFCLSKGLCAPAGSVLVGSEDFIREARRLRKMLGGGMRQAGILAAAGLIALHDMTRRLDEDHKAATRLAEGLADVPGVEVVSNHTNFVFFMLTDDARLSPDAFAQAMESQHNILVRPYPGFKRKFRLVTHYWITPERVETIIQAVHQVLS